MDPRASLFYEAPFLSLSFFGLHALVYFKIFSAFEHTPRFVSFYYTLKSLFSRRAGCR